MSQGQVFPRPLRLLVILEAETVTGPAKNLLQFCSLARPGEPALFTGWLPVETSIATYSRGSGNAPVSSFASAAFERGFAVHILRERFRFDTQVLGQIERLIDQAAPELIQTHNVKTNFLIRLLGRRRSVPWVAFHHGYTAPDLKMRLYNQCNRWSLPGADRVVTVCEAFARELEETGVERARLRVVHNSVTVPAPVEAAEAGRVREGLGLGAEETVLFTAGRFSREKGHIDLVEAYGQLGPDAPRLVMAGDGPERAGITAAIERYGLGSRVLLAGHVPDTRPYYAIAAAVVLPSHSEGSPNVLLEAMAAGVPVVATAAGGVPEIAIDEEHALLVPPRRPRQLAAAIGRLLGSPELAGRIACQAQRHVSAEFSPEKQQERLMGIYRELISR